MCFIGGRRVVYPCMYWVGAICETLGFLCFFVLRVTGLSSRHAIFR